MPHLTNKAGIIRLYFLCLLDVGSVGIAKTKYYQHKNSNLDNKLDK